MTDQFPYHVSARTPNREDFKIPIEEIWRLMENHLYSAKNNFDLRIHAFVLMPNHFHLLVSTPQFNISPSMNYFLGETSREMNRSSGRINQNWGRRHHKTLVSSYHYFMNVYKYIYRNPVRAGLCSQVEEYRYSTLSGLCGRAKLIIPIEADTILFDPNFNEHNLKWLNTSSSQKDEDSIRVALRRSVFELPTDPMSRYCSDLEKRLI